MGMRSVPEKVLINRRLLKMQCVFENRPCSWKSSSYIVNCLHDYNEQFEIYDPSLQTPELGLVDQMLKMQFVLDSLIHSWT